MSIEHSIYTVSAKDSHQFEIYNNIKVDHNDADIKVDELIINNITSPKSNSVTASLILSTTFRH